MESPRNFLNTSDNEEVALMLTEVFEKSLISVHHWTWYDSPPNSMLKSSAPLRVFSR